MSPDEGSKHLDRIKTFKEKVAALEGKGKDVSKVNKILENLERTLETTEEESKIEEAFGKFEKLLDKMENGGKKTKKKRAVKKAKGSKPAEGKEMEPEEPPEEVKDEKEEEKGGKPPEKPPVETEKEESSPTEEGPPEKPSEEVKEEEPSPTEEPKEEQEPESPPPEEIPVEMDPETMEREIEYIRTISKEITELGGDITPIQPHVVAMIQARDAGDIPSFLSYHGATKDWLVTYLISLKRTNIETILTTINSRISDFTKVDEEARVKAIQQAIEKSMIGFNDADLETLGEITKEVQGLEKKMEKAFTDLTEDLTKLINESCSVVEGVLDEISEEVDTTDLKNDLHEVQQHLFNGEFIEARVKGQELLVRTIAERDRKELMKLDSLLLSIEPLLEKIEQAKGKDSGEYRSLDDEKQSIIERSKRDVKDGLAMMEGLLDRASNMATDIEEDYLKQLEKDIMSMRKEAQALSETLNVDPILNILEKARQMVFDGQVDEAKLMMDKAGTAFIKLKEKRAFEVATFRINELKERKEVLGEKGIDVSPLEAPIKDAIKAVQEQNMEAFEKVMSDIDQKLVFIRNEEMKVDYQRSLIKIVNTIKELKEDGQDVSDLDKEVDKFKDLYMKRKYEEAVSHAETVIERLSGRKLYKVIDERKRLVEETLQEAQGLLVDVNISTNKVNEANRLIEYKEYERALDLLIEAQVELEERMTQRTFSLVETEIRELVGECKKYSVEPGDPDGTIANAYSLADQEKFKEAMELLSRYREKLSEKVSVHKVQENLEKMLHLIKQGRSLGLEISPFKASMTKSKVLLDAGDIEASLQLITQQVQSLETTISNKRIIVARLDKLRGNLLAQTGKLSRLARSGISTEEFEERIKGIEQLIDDANHQDAEQELLKMDQDINQLLIAKPEQLRTEMVTSIMDEKPTRPLSIDMMAKPEEPKVEERVMDPDRARNELFTLIPKIKVEITRLHSRGIETEEYKRDIERIQNLVIRRKYIEAYELGKDCFQRMTT